MLVYTVQTGDSLFSIARKFNISVAQLKNTNGLSNNTINIGQQLRVPQQQAVPPASPRNYDVYTVKAGDSLFGIAVAFNTNVPAIKNLNQLNSNVLSIGQQLKIPATASSNSSSSNNSGGTSSGATTTNNNSGNNNNTTGQFANYTVQAGDSLWRISVKFKVTVSQLKQWNNLSSNQLSVGQQLKVKQTNAPSAGNDLFPPQTGDNGSNSSGTVVVPPNSEPVTEEPSTGTGAATQTIQYTVQAGDSLWKIAQKFNVKVDDIRWWNQLSTNNLQLGQVLRIKTNAADNNENPSPPPPSPPNTDTDSDAPPTVILPSNESLVFRFTKTISNTVGHQAKNISKDVWVVQQQLYANGLLSEEALKAEKPFTLNSSTVSASFLPNTIAAIKKMQEIYGKGFNDIEGQIAPDSPSLMYLNTLAVLPNAEQKQQITLNTQNDVGIEVVNGTAALAGGLSAAVGTTNWGNRSSDVSKVQQALQTIGYLSSNHNETPQAGGASLPHDLPKTIQAIRRFQEERVNFWKNKSDLTGSIKFLNGIVDRNDDDLTHKILKEYTRYTFRFKDPQNPSETVSDQLQNYAKSWHTVDTRGVWYVGKLMPSILPLTEYQRLGLDAKQAQALQYVSKHEGNFDAINSYDRAIFSYGFIQFAGAGGGLAPFLGFLKHQYPTTFATYFQQYGIDVCYSIKSGNINYATISFFDTQQDKLLVGEEAESMFRTDKRLTALFVRAAYAKEVQLAQIASAKRNYLVPALNIRFSFSLPVIEELNWDKTGVLKTYVGEKADLFKQSWQYETLKTQGKIRERTLTFDDEPALHFIRSQQGVTALIDLTVNQWTSNTRNYFTEAILKVAAEQQLSSKAAIYQIDNTAVLREITQIGNQLAKQRVSSILNGVDN